MNEGSIKQCTVVLTRGCNLRCNFCFAKKAGYKKDDRIEYDDLKKIVNFCSEAKVKYLFFTGGEPLLYPHIFEILQYIKDECPTIMTAIASNGVPLKDHAFCKTLIDCGLGYIDISLKGKNSHEWHKITGYAGYAEQLQAIHNLSELPVEFTCSMVVTPQNVLTFCETVQTALQNGARQFSFTFFIDNNDSNEKDQQYLEKHDPLTLIDAFLLQTNHLDSITKDWWIEYSFPLCIYSEKQLSLLKGKLASPCQIHMKNAVTFNTKMELLPCDMYIDKKLGQFGIDFSSYQEFIKLVDHPDYQNTMKSLRKLPSLECKSCKYLESCYGGCPVLWNNYSFNAMKTFKKNARLV